MRMLIISIYDGGWEASMAVSDTNVFGGKALICDFPKIEQLAGDIAYGNPEDVKPILKKYLYDYDEYDFITICEDGGIYCFSTK